MYLRDKWADTVLNKYGKEHIEPAMKLIMAESGFNPFAKNPSSGAYGLCQALPATKMASVGDDYLTNPISQIQWCIDYIKRYGNPTLAWKFWQENHWF